MTKPWHRDAVKYSLIIIVSSTISSLIVFAIERAVVADLQNQVAKLKYQVASLQKGSYS